MSDSTEVTYKTQIATYTRSTPDNTWKHANVTGVSLTVKANRYEAGRSQVIFTIKDSKDEETTVVLGTSEMKQIIMQLLMATI